MDVSLDTLDRCANRECPNRANQGTFSVLHMGDDIVGGHRGITLLLCAPCATALFEVGGHPLMPIDYEQVDDAPEVREGPGCPICGEPRGRGQTCGLSCGQKLRYQRDGLTKPPTHQGYLRVWCPGHPTAAADGYAREHRKVAWDNGILTDLANDVHHINGDKTDNRPENLEEIDHSTHKRHHVEQAGFIENQFGVFELRSETCSIDGCDRVTRRRNLCKKHYLEARAMS